MNIAVVGMGSAGKRHVQNLLAVSDAKIIICSKQKMTNPDPNRIKIVKSITECLREKPDVGIVANVSSDHVPTSIKLAKAGADLFIEKPLSNSLKDTKYLSELIRRKKIITQMGCQFRFHKCIMGIKKMIKSGKLGNIISVRVECGSFLPDWHPQEDYTKSYAAQDKLGGGVVLTNIHEIDYLYWFFGDAAEIISVTGKYSNLKISSSDLSASVIKFRNNVIAELHLDYFQKPEFRSCKVIGTNGTAYWDSDTNKIMMYDNKKNKWIKVLGLSNYDRNTMFKEEMIHFLNCVKKRKATINPAEYDGIKTLKIGLAIVKSSNAKKVIRL